MRMMTAVIALAAATGLGAPAFAQEATELATASAEDLAEVAAAIPDREWYPQGYYDIRVAYAADFPEAERLRIANHVANFGGTPEDYYGEGPSEQVNLGDCDVEDTGVDYGEDPLYATYVSIARDMSYFRAALERGGYPPEIFEPALLDYERRRLALAQVEADGRDPAEVDFAAEFGLEDFDPQAWQIGAFMERLNAARTGENAGLPEVILADGCGGDSPPVILRTAPGNGQVWIISAFAFRVCTRRMSDPWDKFACRWNEIETGAENSLAGRYVYEVVWPDGTSRRGTRELRGDVMTWEPKTVTFRKSGS